MAHIRKAKAIERLEKLLEEASELESEDGRSQKTLKWTQDVYSAFIYIFGKDSRQYTQLPGSHKITPSGVRDYLNVIVSIVASNLDDVRYFWEDEEESVTRSEDQSGLSVLDIDRVDMRLRPVSNKVFVVHGHEEATRDAVARFLTVLELEPIILHEQANRGRTIIEKFEDHADVGFAVVLLTPDDIGAAIQDQDKIKRRARQNVILELGFFIGKLGRERVCALRAHDIETPSDFDGVVYIVLDEPGAWKMALARELKDAGFDIDANRVLQP